MQPLALEAFRLHREHFAPPLRPRLQLAVDEADRRRLESSKELYDSAPGFSGRWLERPEMLELEPALDDGVRAGLLTEGNCKVDAAEYTRAVAAAAAPTVLRGEVTGLSEGAVHVGDQRLECDGVVIATGPWCEGPAEWLGLPLPVEPVEGEMRLVERPAGARVDMAWREAGVYAAGPDRVWLGGPRELMRGVLPDLDGAPVLRRSSAPRPSTPDGLPIVGLVKPAVCVALGGGRKGMLLSSALGLAAAELLTAGRTSLPIDPCTPERCSGLSASAA
jgi:D-amino-acid dehydrogenase